MKRYLVVCGEEVLGSYDSLADAAKAGLGCSSPIKIYRCSLAAELSPTELQQLIGAAGEPAEREASRKQRPAARQKPRAAVVLDQMFKTFAEILDRELRDAPLVFHEVLGRGLEKPLRVSERIYQQPARDDYDILKLLENLSTKYDEVIFFTGDKRLAAQARTLPRVHVEYLPPGEVGGKEHAIKLMATRIRSIIHGTGGGEETPR